jgi:hypothetical protein
MFYSPHQPVKDLRAEAPATRLDLTCELWLATRLYSFLHLEPPLGQLAVERQFHRSAAPECIAHLTESGFLRTWSTHTELIYECREAKFDALPSALHLWTQSVQRKVNKKNKKGQRKEQNSGLRARHPKTGARCCPHGQLGRSRLGERMY